MGKRGIITVLLVSVVSSLTFGADYHWVCTQPSGSWSTPENWLDGNGLHRPTTSPTPVDVMTIDNGHKCVLDTPDCIRQLTVDSTDFEIYIPNTEEGKPGILNFYEESNPPAQSRVMTIKAESADVTVTMTWGDIANYYVTGDREHILGEICIIPSYNTITFDHTNGIISAAKYYIGSGPAGTLNYTMLAGYILAFEEHFNNHGETLFRQVGGNNVVDYCLDLQGYSTQTLYQLEGGYLEVNANGGEGANPNLDGCLLIHETSFLNHLGGEIHVEGDLSIGRAEYNMGSQGGGYYWPELDVGGTISVNGESQFSHHYRGTMTANLLQAGNSSGGGHVTLTGGDTWLNALAIGQSGTSYLTVGDPDSPTTVDIVLFGHAFTPPESSEAVSCYFGPHSNFAVEEGSWCNLRFPTSAHNPLFVDESADRELLTGFQYTTLDYSSCSELEAYGADNGIPSLEEFSDPENLTFGEIVVGKPLGLTGDAGKAVYINRLTFPVGGTFVGLETNQIPHNVYYLQDNEAPQKLISGDANLDGKVSFADYLILESNFGKTERTWHQADFNADGKVSFADYLILEREFGHTSGSSAMSGGDAGSAEEESPALDDEMDEYAPANGEPTSLPQLTDLNNDGTIDDADLQILIDAMKEE